MSKTETTPRKGNYVKMNDILHTLPLHKGLLPKFVKNLEIETGGEDLSDFVLDCLERAWIETMADASQARAERLRERL